MVWVYCRNMDRGEKWNEYDTQQVLKEIREKEISIRKTKKKYSTKNDTVNNTKWNWLQSNK